jgi:truncated hemoglobin YjbI
VTSEDTEFAVVSAVERRAEITASIQAETGIDEAMIERLVRGFYARVREDPLIGPVFVARIMDWEPHLQRMCAFWSSVTLMTGRYQGQPMQKHLSLPVDVRHFDRWLALFEASSVMSADQKSSAKLPSAVILGLLGRRSHCTFMRSYVRFVSGSGASLARSAHSLAWTRYCSARVVTASTHCGKREPVGVGTTRAPWTPGVVCDGGGEIARLIS